MDINEEFQKIRQILGLGNELVERINKSPQDLDTCGGLARKDEENNTCALCVAVNRTVYRNYNRCNMMHPHCKCIYKSFNGKLSVLFDTRKITDYLYVDVNKTRAMKSMGYYPEDSQEVYDYVKGVVLRAYEQGDYLLLNVGLTGQRGQIDFILKGKRDHSGELFNCHTGCVFMPGGVIKIVSPVIKD